MAGAHTPVSLPTTTRANQFWRRPDVQSAFVRIANSDGAATDFDALAEQIRETTGRYFAASVVEREFGAWMGRTAMKSPAPTLLRSSPRVVGGRVPVSPQRIGGVVNATGFTSLMAIKKGTLLSTTRKSMQSPVNVTLTTNLARKRQARVLATSETFHVENSIDNDPVPRKRVHTRHDLEEDDHLLAHASIIALLDDHLDRVALNSSSITNLCASINALLPTLEGEEGRLQPFGPDRTSRLVTLRQRTVNEAATAELRARLAAMPDQFADREPSADGKSVSMCIQVRAECRTLGTQTSTFTSPYACPEREENHVQPTVTRYTIEQPVEGGQPAVIHYEAPFAADGEFDVYHPKPNDVVIYADDEQVTYVTHEGEEEEMVVVGDGQATHSASGQEWMTHESGIMGNVRQPKVYLESFGGVSLVNQRPLLYECVSPEDYRPLFRKQSGGSRAQGIRAESDREGFAYYECIGCNTVLSSMRRECKVRFKCARDGMTRNRATMVHGEGCPCQGDPAPRRYKYHEPSSTVMWTHNQHLPQCHPHSRVELAAAQVQRVMTKYVRDDGFDPSLAFYSAMDGGEDIARPFGVPWRSVADSVGVFEKHRRRLRAAMQRSQQKGASLTTEDDQRFVVYPPNEEMLHPAAESPLRHYEVLHFEGADEQYNQQHEHVDIT